MKTDRFSSSLAWATAVLLVVLVSASGRPGAGQSITFRFGRQDPAPEASSKRLADELADQVGEVRKTFAAKRLALHTVPGKSGARDYVLNEVFDLISGTRRDLDQAIARVGEPGLQGLRFWAAEKLKRVQNEVPASATVNFSSLTTPRAVAVVASREWLPLPRLAAGRAAPRPETISAEKANGLLDQVAAVVEQIFLLASHDDLEVKLWVGSTEPKVQFSFWPMGEVKGSPAEPIIIRTDGWREHVLRGLYEYNAAWTDGAVTHRIRYPNPVGGPAATPSERLDLVKGSTFFCCRFDENYCHHVEGKTECRP
jgi:hypothetical protein